VAQNVRLYLTLAEDLGVATRWSARARCRVADQQDTTEHEG
jgi:hypothetical protein